MIFFASKSFSLSLYVYYIKLKHINNNDLKAA